MIRKLLVWWIFTLFFITNPIIINAQDTNTYRWSLPLENLKITSGYGYRIHPVTKQHDFHKGIDLAARCDPVLSVLAGIVTETGYNPILGKYVRIGHGDFQSIYGHLSYILVCRGDTVDAKQPIAITGTTGRVTGEHLHFSVKFRNNPINPLLFLWQMALPEQMPSITKQ
ncbi:M23 family metallopeptidase [Pedobacter helvus]|uniref:M23 family metallopeptidase n=1 Tax=Pedobacter helvus TaxID=2563444 RepID=A0ABW9JPF2_9SPHI|nr:M23 family metallopeptidase [Pedobacter ureilyticus]